MPLVLSPEASCDICLDQYTPNKEAASLGCGHCFCRSCIYTLTTRVCPVCRQPFSVNTDLRKLHADFADSKSPEITAQERKALEACRSGDVLLMEAAATIIEEWLQTQSLGSRTSLPTVVELIRLLIGATAQLHHALERAQDDEHSSKQRYKLEEMSWTAEKRRLIQENAALQEGLSRQKEHLAYLQSELSSLRAQQHQELRPAPSPTSERPTPPAALPANQALPSPTSPRASSPHRPPAPSNVLAPLPTKPKTPVPPETPNPAHSTNTRATTTDLPVTVVTLKASTRRTRSALNGPRPPSVPMGSNTRTQGRPPGAAPSAFMSTPRSSLGSEETQEPVRTPCDPSKRTSLPTLTRPEYMGSRSFDSSVRAQRYSASPTPWRTGTLQGPPQDSEKTEQTSSPSRLRSAEAGVTPARPPRTLPPAAETPSLSRKRALRRQSKDIHASGV